MLIQPMLRKTAQIMCLSSVVFCAQALDLRTELSKAEFESAGLTKLSADEISALQRFIDRGVTSAQAAPAATSAPMPIPKVMPASSESSPNWQPPAPSNAERSVIETEVTEEFKGLFGTTVVKFSNGQVWQQTDRARFDRVLRDRRVRIKPAIMGRWRMQFLDNNESFVVKRIK
jgi:hypothetical protein